MTNEKHVKKNRRQLRKHNKEIFGVMQEELKTLLNDAPWRKRLAFAWGALRGDLKWGPLLPEDDDNAND